MMHAIVCGGRDFSARSLVGNALNALSNAMDERTGSPITLVIEGGANGADKCAREWAIAEGVATERMNADWSKGKGAGPARNRKMLEHLLFTAGGTANAAVIAFPGGRGTASMVRLAREAGVKVYEMKTEWVVA